MSAERSTAGPDELKELVEWAAEFISDAADQTERERGNRDWSDNEIAWSTVVRRNVRALRAAVTTAGPDAATYDEGFRRGLEVAKAKDRPRTLSLIAQYVREEISTGKLAEMLEIDHDADALRDIRDAVQGPVSVPMSTAGPDELPPCPFCGGACKSEAYEDGWLIGCWESECMKPVTWRETEAEAIAAWNRRTSLAEGAQPERERIARIVHDAMTSVSPGEPIPFDDRDPGERAFCYEWADKILRSAAPAAGTRIEEMDAREQSDAARWLEGEMAENDGWSITVPYQYAAALRDAIRIHSAAPTGGGERRQTMSERTKGRVIDLMAALRESLSETGRCSGCGDTVSRGEVDGRNAMHRRSIGPGQPKIECGPVRFGATQESEQ